MLSLHKVLRKYREKDNLTQTQLAKELHVSRKTISGWETGHRQPDINSLIRLSRIYGVSLVELIRGSKLHHISRLVLFAYYLNIFLLLLSYLDLFGLITVIIPLLLLLNSLFLLIRFRHWIQLFHKKYYLLKVTLFSVLYFIINLTACVMSRRVFNAFIHIGDIPSSRAGDAMGALLLIITMTIACFVNIIYYSIQK